MRHAHFAEICGNMCNMRQSHIRVKLTDLFNDAEIGNKSHARMAVTVNCKKTFKPAAVESSDQSESVLPLRPPLHFQTLRQDKVGNAAE